MERISSTDIFNHWGQVLRRATKHPYIIESHGKPKAMLVPMNFRGLNFFDQFSIEDVPSWSRYNRSDIIAWLGTKIFERLLDSYPNETMSVIQQNMENIRKNQGADSTAVKKLEALLSMDRKIMLNALLEDSDQGNWLRQIFPKAGLIGITERYELLDASRRLEDELDDVDLLRQIKATEMAAALPQISTGDVAGYKEANKEFRKAAVARKLLNPEPAERNRKPKSPRPK